MEINKLKGIVYATSWVENYLEALVKDLPQHAELLKSYHIVSDGVTELRRENEAMERKLNNVRASI